MLRKITICLFISIFISCSNNKTDDPVTFHFSKKEMSDLNKTGKIVQTDDKGVERVFIYDDKFSKTSKKTETDPKKTKEEQEAEKRN